MLFRSQLDWNVIKDDSWYQSYSGNKKELKQAEFLIYKHLPINGLAGIVCHNDRIANFVLEELNVMGLSIPVAVKPEFYFL